VQYDNVDDNIAIIKLSIIVRNESVNQYVHHFLILTNFIYFIIIYFGYVFLNFLS